MSTSYHLVAGMAAAVSSFLVFLIIHHFWIEPIWNITVPGLVIALLGGLAVGWSYHEIQAGLPPRPWTSLAMLGLVTLILLPGIILAQFHVPTLDLETFSIPPENYRLATRQFFLELALTATLVGGLAGWLLGHTQKAVLSTALAGLVYALGPGHNIPFLGRTPATGKGLILLLVITITACVVLVESSTLLSRA